MAGLGRLDWSQESYLQGKAGKMEEEGESGGEVLTKRAKLMNGRYYMEGKMRGRSNLMRGGSQGLGSISNGLYTGPALLQRGVGDIIIPLAL